MNITIENANGMTIAHLTGRLDTPATAEVSPYFDQLQNAADGTVLLDCTELAYISSSGLRLFLSLRKAATVKGGKVIVKNISNDIRQVFMMTGFLNLFEIQ
jgi:anti-sigma B factor antagonist